MRIDELFELDPDHFAPTDALLTRMLCNHDAIIEQCVVETQQILDELMQTDDANVLSKEQTTRKAT